MAIDPITQNPSLRSSPGRIETQARHIKETYFSHRRDIRLAGTIQSVTEHTLSTGFDILDHCLPGGGWPLGALTEILTTSNDPGGLWITMPALTRLSRQQQWVAMVSPPCIPYAPALTALGMDTGKILLIHPKAHNDGLWAIEEALKSDTCSCVLFWLNGPNNKTLRRLQLASEYGGTLGFCFRPAHNAGQRTTAALRLKVNPENEGAGLDILKIRGGRPQQNLKLRFSDIHYC